MQYETPNQPYATLQCACLNRLKVTSRDRRDLRCPNRYCACAHCGGTCSDTARNTETRASGARLRLGRRVAVATYAVCPEDTNGNLSRVLTHILGSRLSLKRWNVHTTERATVACSSTMRATSHARMSSRPKCTQSRQSGLRAIAISLYRYHDSAQTAQPASGGWDSAMTNLAACVSLPMAITLHYPLSRANELRSVRALGPSPLWRHACRSERTARTRVHEWCGQDECVKSFRSLLVVVLCVLWLPTRVWRASKVGKIPNFSVLFRPARFRSESQN